MKPGRKANGMFFLHRGLVQIRTRVEPGLTRVISDGMYFGEASLFHTNMIRSIEAEALTNAYMYYLKRKDFFQV